LCGEEYVFLERMIDVIDVPKESDYLTEYQKAYNETKVNKCTLAPLFQKLFERSKNLEIVKD
jgi:hypothetical protein